MITRIIGSNLIASLCLIACMAHSQGVPQDRFLGEWVNVDAATRSMTRVSIFQSHSGWKVRAFGACSPTDCEWGEVPFYWVSDSVDSTSYDRGYAIWDFAFAIVYVSFKIEGSQLGLEEFTIFHDGSGRSNYRTVESMEHPPALAIRTIGPNVTLQWTESATNYVLLSATSPSPSADWTAVTNSPVVLAGHFTVTVQESKPAGFFRLRRRP